MRKRKPPKVILPSGRNVYYAHLRLPDDSRWKKTLGTSDELLAQSLLEELSSFMNNLEHYKGKSTDIADYVLHHINAVMIKLGEEPVQLSFSSVQPNKKLGEAVNEWITYKEARISDDNAITYNSWKSMFTDIAQDYLSKDIVEFSGDDAQAIITAHSEGKGGKRKNMKGRSTATTRNFKKKCSSLFDWAKDEGYVELNPFKNDIYIKEVAKMPKYPFTNDEIERLRNCEDEEWRLFILFATSTLMRIGDVSQAGRDYFKRRNGKLFISFVPDKKIKQDYITMPVVEPLLSALDGKTDRDKLFPTLSRCKVGGTTGLDAKFVKIMEECEIDYETLTTPAGNTWRTKHFHSTRHWGATALINAGVPQKTVMKLAGHLSEQVNDMYVHHDTESALNKLNTQ